MKKAIQKMLPFFVFLYFFRELNFFFFHCQFFFINFFNRTNPKSPEMHSILGITDHPVREIASELGVDLNQVWGGLKYILIVLRKLSEGSYILLRDPQRVCAFLFFLL